MTAASRELCSPFFISVSGRTAFSTSKNFFEGPSASKQVGTLCGGISSSGQKRIAGCRGKTISFAPYSGLSNSVGINPCVRRDVHTEEREHGADTRTERAEKLAHYEGTRLTGEGSDGRGTQSELALSDQAENQLIRIEQSTPSLLSDHERKVQ